MLILHERLEQRKKRPDVVGLVLLTVADGPEPTVGLLVSSMYSMAFLDLAFEHRVVGQESQWNKAVEPVRNALPTLGAAAEPGAVP